MFRIFYSTNVMEYILRFWVGLLFVFFIHIYYEKSTHIFHNISKSQNAVHNICRVRDFERNKTHCSSFNIVGLISDFIRKKTFSVETNYQMKYKHTYVSLCVCRASLSDFYVSNYCKIIRERSLNCIVSY